MLNRKTPRRVFSPSQLIVLGFAVLIAMGAALLTMPFAVSGGGFNSLIDALFTATTAVCVTGLTVVDTGSYYTSAGHVVILVLIQIGGLGVVTAATFYTLLLGKKIGLRERVILKEALNRDNLGGVVRLVRSILIITLIIESTGALILTAAFLRYFPPLQALWYGVFHSISAFCNAGIDLLGGDFTPFAGLVVFQHDPIILLTIGLLIVLGGIGFTVILDVNDQKRDLRRLSLHTKLALVTTGALIVIGFVFFLATEWNTALQGMGIADRLSNALFMGITPRTAGFASVDMTALLPATILIFMILMFVGASPGGTGGGIKTTTFALLLLRVRSNFKSRGDLVIFHRRIEQDLVSRAFSIIVMSSGVVFVCILLLSLLDSHDLIMLMFEAVSAFGTVGLSMGITPELSTGAKLVLIILMFFGRLGPLTLAFAMLERGVGKEKVRYPRGNVIIG